MRSLQWYKRGAAYFRDIYESDNIKIYNIGYKLFYVNKINKK